MLIHSNLNPNYEELLWLEYLASMLLVFGIVRLQRQLQVNLEQSIFHLRFVLVI